MSDNSNDAGQVRGRRWMIGLLIFFVCIGGFGPYIVGGLNIWFGPSGIVAAITAVGFVFFSVFWAFMSLPDIPFRELKESWKRGKVIREQAAKPQSSLEVVDDEMLVRRLLRARDKAEAEAAKSLPNPKQATPKSN